MKKKRSKKRFKFQKRMLFPIVTAVAVIILAILLIILLTPSTPAAIVNGETITVKELDNAYKRIPVDLQSFVTKQDLLEQLINEKVLLQEASKQGFATTDQEVSQAITDSLTQAGMTEQQFLTTLKEEGLTIKDMQDYFKKQLTVTKLLNSTIPSDLNISDLDAVNNFTQSYLEDLKNKANIITLIDEEIDSQPAAELVTSSAADNECLADYSINEEVIFIYSDSCPYCQNMKPIVTELESEGYNFYWAGATQEAQEMVTTCLSGLASGYVPQFICAATGAEHTGAFSKTGLKEFIDDNC